MEHFKTWLLKTAIKAIGLRYSVLQRSIGARSPNFNFLMPIKPLVLLGTLSLLVALPTQSAIAQAAYGSYVGVGGSLRVNSNSGTEGSALGGVVAVRYKLLERPFSLRTQALVGSSPAVVPTVSFDLPINWQTDIYLGAGVAFANSDTASPVGNKTSFVLQPGIDYVVPNSNTVIFGNAIIAFNAYRNRGGSAFAVQGGVGLRF